MKNIKNYLFLTATFLGIYFVWIISRGKREDQISVDYIYNSPAGLQVGVNALYNQMRYYNLPSGDTGDLWSNVFYGVQLI
jgi:hypothetical protein